MGPLEFHPDNEESMEGLYRGRGTYGHPYYLSLLSVLGTAPAEKSTRSACHAYILDFPGMAWLSNPPKSVALPRFNYPRPIHRRSLDQDICLALYIVEFGGLSLVKVAEKGI